MATSKNGAPGRPTLCSRSRRSPTSVGSSRVVMAPCSVVQVVVDHRRPRPVGLDPGLGLAGGAGGELQETGGVFVHVQIRVLATPEVVAVTPTEHARFQDLGGVQLKGIAVPVELSVALPPG